MADQVEARDHIQDDWEIIFEEALKQPGISVLMQIYDEAEAVYSAAHSQEPQPTEYISSSANRAPARPA